MVSTINKTRSDHQGPIPVMLLVSSLECGGAERQVVELMREIDRSRFAPVVCSLSAEVPLADALPDPARELVIVEKRWKFDATTVLRAARVMRERRIQVVHAFLHDAEIVARLAARMAGVSVVIASERNTDYRLSLVEEACLRLTRPFFHAMIANSTAGKRFNIRTLGIPAHRIHVIHNGVDVRRFTPGGGDTVRRELGIRSEDHVVGMVAHFKRQKNHGDFFRMAREVLKRFRDTWFLCVGEPLRDNQQGAADYHREMRCLLDSLGIAGRFHLLGNRHDMPAVYNACDVTVLSSVREGTPNVLLESMACGVPVVATDVADNAAIVPNGQTGFIVALGDVDALTDRVCQLLGDSEFCRTTGRNAREWVTRQFSTAALARKTEAVYLDLLHRNGHKPRRSAGDD